MVSVKDITLCVDMYAASMPPIQEKNMVRQYIPAHSAIFRYPVILRDEQIFPL